MNHHYVYVIQLGEDPKRVYVGQTGKTPEERFEDHRTGHRSSRVVKRYADCLTLRPDLAPSQAFTFQESQEAEAALARQLRSLGYDVYGGH